MVLYLLMVIGAVLAMLMIAIRRYANMFMDRCRCFVCLVGKTALVTGGNSGIGFQTALGLAARGCRVIIADRDDCEESKEKIINITGNKNVLVKQFDLNSFHSIRQLAENINSTEERLDILINNAGTLDAQNSMQVNHFGPFLLTHLLVGILKRSAPSRIIFVSSVMAYFSKINLLRFDSAKENPSMRWQLAEDLAVYSNSKLCTVVTANGFAEKLKGAGVTSNSLHPGIVFSPLVIRYVNGGKRHEENTFRLKLISFAMKLVSVNSEEAAQCSLHLSMAKNLERVSGKFFIACREFTMPAAAENVEFSKKLWITSEDFVQLAAEEKL